MIFLASLDNSTLIFHHDQQGYYSLEPCDCPVFECDKCINVVIAK